MDDLPVGLVTLGDCVEVMASWPAASVSAIVCDPPYGLEFMGREWDRFSPSAPTRRSGWANAEAGERLNPDARDSSTPAGRSPVAFGKRRQTYTCDTCGKRDAFRNVHGCEPGTWSGEWVDELPLEALSYQEWCRQWATEALRVAKPGAHLLAFGGTRTYHRLACAIEDAGWEVRDCLVWGYAQGFPKSHDVGKAIDRMAGAEREKVPVGDPVRRMIPGADQEATGSWIKDNGRTYQPGIEAPVTAAAAAWDGWGTALKPAWEPIILARKPLTGSVARNVLDHGTGALNIDGARIPMAAEDAARIAEGGGFLRAGYDAPEAVAYDGNMDGSLARKADAEVSEGGRWPANIVLTDPIFDGGILGVVGGGSSDGGAAPVRTATNDVYGPLGGYEQVGAAEYDAGTYSRFFLVPKANRADREPIVRGQVKPSAAMVASGGGGTQKQCGLCGERWVAADGLPRCGHGKEHVVYVPQANRPRENTHPTVKPLELMRHLVRLVTPPGGVVLDPFLGSGTTALAAELEGFPWAGIERDPDSVVIAEARLHGTQRGMGLEGPAPTSKRSKGRGHWPKARGAHGDGTVYEGGFAGQLGLEERSAP